MNKAILYKIMKSRIWLILCGFLLFGIAGTAQAQTQLDRVEGLIAQTEKLLEEARVIIAESGSEQGMQYLEKAYYLQEQAKEHYAQRKLQSAERLTLQARELVEKAVALIRKSDESRGYVEREIDKTDEIIQQAREKSGSLTASRYQVSNMLESAISTQNKARELYLQNQQKMALATTLRARELVQKGMESVQTSGQAGRELEKTEMLLDRAREMLAQLNQAQTPPDFENALKMYRQAKELYENGSYKQSQELALKSRQQILDAINHYEEQIQKENFPRILEDISGKLDQASADLKQNPNAVAEKYLERSRNEIVQAREAYQGGNVQRAMFHLRRANNFLGEVSEIIGL